MNKQYSKEEYEKLKVHIVEDMKNNPYIDERGVVWPYGEFFGSGFRRFAYNNSNAIKFFPETKEEALAEGYSWNDEENLNNQYTMKSSDLPETIKETAESILEEVIECATCGRSYKIIKGELDLMRKMNLPLPHNCPKCRDNNRFSRLTKPKLYHRICIKCEAPIYTPYSAEDPRIVYCVKCYQQEFA